MLGGGIIVCENACLGSLGSRLGSRLCSRLLSGIGWMELEDGVLLGETTERLCEQKGDNQRILDTTCFVCESSRLKVNSNSMSAELIYGKEKKTLNLFIS